MQRAKEFGESAVMVNIRQMEARMEINILDYRLKVMSIKKPAISRFTHALLDVIFLKHYLDKDTVHDNHGFVSVTETDEDYSIIIEENALSMFNTSDADLSVVDDIWLPLVASAGPVLTEVSTSGISKIANSVVIPLADQGISVYCLSTYRTDYVLIQEKNLEAACEVLARNFRITKEGVLDSMEIVVDPTNINKLKPVRDATSRPLTLNFTCSSNKFYITSMDCDTLPSCALTLMDILFYSVGKKTSSAKDFEQFCSFSIVEQDISLVLDSTAIERFPQNVLFNTSECWHMIKIIDMPEGLGFRRAGIVAQISEPIASAQISEYYISSYFYGHTLVPVEHFKNVQQILESKKKSQ